MTGTFILAFGWFGFNAGSTLAGTDSRLAIVATNTLLASATGAFGAFLYVKLRFGKPDPTWLANGMLAGLVAITAPCAFVSSGAAMFIGLFAGVLVVVAAMFIERTLKIDDPVGASAVHGVNGAWGVISLGLFANGTYGHGLNGIAGGVRGALYGAHGFLDLGTGDWGQLGASIIGIFVNVAWVGSVSALAFFLIGKLVRNRASAEDEVNGLDIPEMGILGYDDPGSLMGGSVHPAGGRPSRPVI
jgi:Amt family ammonium transporter